MSWQDRDYAREVPGGWGRRGGYQRPFYSSRWTMVKMIMAVNIGIYAMSLFLPKLYYGVLLPLGVMQVAAVWEGQLWRLFTATYFHAGLMHILLNMIGLHFLGPPVEQRWGPRKFFAIYTIAGILGNVALMILANPNLRWLNPEIPAMGASGSILALLGACAVLFPRSEVYVYFLFPVNIRTAAIVFGVLYVLNVLRQGENFGGDACHIAGLLFGAWWAWQGDRWWSGESPWAALRRGGSGQGVRRARWRPVSTPPPVDPSTVDQILRKVYEGGIHTLTPDERRILTEASERQRARDSR